MKLLRRAWRWTRFWRPNTAIGIVMPATVIFAVAASSLVLALEETAHEVNRTASFLTRQTVEAAVEATLRRMANTHGDYAIWDDAARALYSGVDTDFVEDNFATGTQNPVFFDTAYLLDPDGSTVFAFHLGSVASRPPQDAFGPSFARLMTMMSEPKGAPALSALVGSAWGPMVVALGPVVPFSQHVPVPTAKRVLVLGKTLSRTVVAQLSEDYLIQGLELAVPSAARNNPSAMPLADVDGRTIAAFTWPLPLPGSEALERLNPRVNLMLAMLAVTMLLLVAMATYGFARLRRGEAQERFAASHDPLSRLPNRAALLAHLKTAIRSHRRDQGPALVCIELDGLKEVNDTYGHEVGDHVIREAANRFRALAGKYYLARLGGDEFAMAVDGVRPSEEAVELGERLVWSLTEPFDIGGRIISIGVSVGVVLVDRHMSAREALRCGDAALYQARHEGRNRVCLFDDSLDRVRRKRIEIAGDLRRALAIDGLALFYQPVFSAEDGRIISAEALVRWTRDGGSEPVAPAEFIPIAEETGLIDELGLWTLRRACRDGAAWPGLKISVNVSPAQFPNPNFARAVAGVLMETGFPADRLELEVTETYLVTHPEQARKAIDSIRKLGVTVALDDFGVGYSSIGYLRSFAFDKLKLDRSLIAHIDRDPSAQKLVQATIALADALELSVTAEGVETEAEATLLRIAGCDAFQGFYFGRPAPAAELTALLAGGAGLHSPARPLMRA